MCCRKKHLGQPTLSHQEEAVSDSSGNSLLQGMDTPICQPDLSSRKVSCLPAEILQVRSKEQTDTGDKAVSVCCDQEEHVDGQLEAASHLQALILMGHFDHPDICWYQSKKGMSNPEGSWITLMMTS